MSIVLDHVNYTYSAGTAYEKHALKDINLVIPDGQFIGLIGHTGSGKSTLIQHLNGLIKATSGAIYYDGHDIYDDDFSKKELRTKVGLVFQYPEHQMRTFEAIKMVGISEELYDASPFELSGGQKRRVAIAGVLAMKPEVLVLDEPTAGLDPMGRDEILDQIAAIQKERGITVILVSHSMEDVAKYVDRLIVMDHGSVQYDGTPREVFSHYKELEAMGLAAPQVTYVMENLKAQGMNVGDATTVEEAKNEILRAWKKI